MVQISKKTHETISVLYTTDTIFLPNVRVLTTKFVIRLSSYVVLGIPVTYPGVKDTSY